MSPPPIKTRRPIGRRSLWLWLALVSIGVGWGMAGPLSKLAVSTGHHPLGVAFCNTAVGVVIATALLVISRGRPPLTRDHLIFYLCCGLLGRALPSVLNYTAFAHLPVGVVVLINATVPMATFLLALTLRIETTDIRRLAGLGLGILAIMLIVLPETSLPSPEQAAWIALPVIVSLCYAAESVYIAMAKPADCGALTMICGVTWGAFFVLAPVTLAWDAWPEIETLGPPEIAIAAGAVLHSPPISASSG